jgi:proteasome lid subunit RPN8/RPN11
MSDAEIEFGEVETAQPEERLIPTKDPSRRVQAMGTISQDDLHVFLREETLREIVIYSKTTTSYELGGVLIGSFYRHGTTHWIEIAGYVKAVRFKNTSASFTFTLDTQEQIQREKEKRFNDLPILGWHHTHPRYGIFLSGHDMFIHNNFFQQPWHVALVVDPVADTMGFFQMKRGRVVPCGFFYIYDRVAAAR